MNKKWSKIDILILVLELLSPIIALIATSFIPLVRDLSEDIKLAIIGSGISIPIVLLQISHTVSQNKSDKDLEDINNKVNKLDDKINHVSPVLEEVFLCGNERTKRFVYRRMNEVVKTIKSAINNNNSGQLNSSEYYQELLYLAELILEDKEKHGKKFNGEIWAMTSFADDEWVADEGYEKYWTEKLVEIADKGITTRRLCIVPDNVYDIISQDNFVEPNSNERAYSGFVELLSSYYGNESRKQVTEHYFIRPNDNEELTNIKGFFAIQLTNGDLHILYGETVDNNGAMTAKVLFDPEEIKEVHKLFQRYTTNDNYRMENVIRRVAKENGFLDFLSAQNIEL